MRQQPTTSIWALDALAAEVARRQRTGERGVFTNGVFDLLHQGHLRYLQDARALGDFLVVGVNDDESVRRIKGPKRPLVPEHERAELVGGLACVDYVTVFGDNTAEAVVRALRPSIYLKGADYIRGRTDDATITLRPDELRAVLAGDLRVHPELAGLAERLAEARVVAEYGGTLCLVSGVPDRSTSALIQRIVERYGSGAADGDASSENRLKPQRAQRAQKR
ncbi:MAG TPA: adenylyltransferase/cytidyltransferase family protein [Ktedonobacterales bacterium]